MISGPITHSIQMSSSGASGRRRPFFRALIISSRLSSAASRSPRLSSKLIT